MSYKVNSDFVTLRAQRHLVQSQRQVEKSLASLATGRKIVRPGDDAAGFAISESLRGQVSGTRQAQSNAEQAMSFIQTAEGGLNEQANILIRLRELAVQSASDTVSNREREFLNMEFGQLKQEFDRIAQSTRFGEQPLLTGSGKNFEFHVGPFAGGENIISFRLDADTSGRRAGISSAEVNNQRAARRAIEDLDQAMGKVAEVRAQFGAAHSRFQYAVDNLAVQTENLETARSQIVDVDVAAEVSQLTRHQIMQDMGISVMAQAKVDAARAVRLLGF